LQNGITPSGAATLFSAAISASTTRGFQVLSIAAACEISAKSKSRSELHSCKHDSRISGSVDCCSLTTREFRVFPIAAACVRSARSQKVDPNCIHANTTREFQVVDCGSLF
jgi:hypothetical protein